MRLVFGLLAATFLGTEGPQGPDASEITYQIKLLEMNGLGWRTASQSQLQPVTRKGSTTVWTTSREVAAKLAGKAGKVAAAPKVTAYSQAQTTFYSNTTRNLVTELSRPTDASGDHASFAGFTPKIEKATEGWAAHVSGRKLDQGVLIRVALEDHQITAVHPVSVCEAAGSGRSCDEKICTASIQLPEVAHAEVAGEWLVPNDAVLVVSFGTHTVADADGKAVVRERLALLEAKEVDGDAVRLPVAPAQASYPLIEGGNPGTLGASAIPNQAPIDSPPAPMAVNYGPPTVLNATPVVDIPMPNPAPPSRSLPLALNEVGEPAILPPLPDDEAPPTVLAGSLVPCATPQTRPEPVGDPIPGRPAYLRDDASRQVSFEDDPACLAEKAESKSGWAPAPNKGFTFRIPGAGNLQIEVRATVVPTPSAGVSAPPLIKR